MKKRGKRALVDSKEVGFRRGRTVLSSQSAFLATSSISFLSWKLGDGDACNCKNTHWLSLHLILPNRRALDFSIEYGAGYIWTGMNHCLFNVTLIQENTFLRCITKYLHTWSGRRRHSDCKKHCQEPRERLTGSSSGSHCLPWRRESLVLEEKSLWLSGCLLDHPAMGLHPWP